MMKFLRTMLILMSGMIGCSKSLVPILVIPETSLGEGSRVSKNLFLSSWKIPSSDNDLIKIGIIMNSPVVRFQALHDMRIRVLSEESNWEIASPKGVIWKVEPVSIVRPPVMSYLPMVQSNISMSNSELSPTEPEVWKKRGFPMARWIGVGSLLQESNEGFLERKFLTLVAPTSKEQAQSICKQVVSKWKVSCQCVGRVELPPVARGRVMAQNSNFSKEFVGLLELSSLQGPVRILDVVPEERTAQTSEEDYGPRLFIVPGVENDLSLVQSTTLGNYVESVVPSEIFSSAPSEALRAQAVVARTYAIRYMELSMFSKPFQICGSTQCQVYRGVNYKRETTSQAVKDTSDLILLDEKSFPVEAFYHSICGGHTESRQTIWGSASQSYLKGVSDQLPNQSQEPLHSNDKVQSYMTAPATSYCGLAEMTRGDRWRWTRTMDMQDISKMLKSLDLTPPLLDLRILQRGISGRALQMEIVTKDKIRIISNELKIRLALGGLLSSLIVVNVEKDPEEGITKILIQGAGYGHGVGLCQMGAIGRAEHGQNFKEILTTYYPGTTIAPIASSAYHQSKVR